MRTELGAALGSVVDPQLDLTVADAGLLASLEATPSGPKATLALPTADWPTATLLEARLGDAARLAGEGALQLDTRPMTESETRALRDALRARMSPAPEEAANGHGHGHGGDDDPPAFLRRDGTTRVLAISSGKGGVGKSTVTVNLAISLAQRGHRVGVLDADVYGFSVARMVAAAVEPAVLLDTVVPSLAHGVRWLSMGWFVPDAQPVIWRGPLLHKAITQFVTEAWWGEPDYLVVDMPPGTGDVALTLSQVVARAEVYVVTTPQAAAQRVAQRSALAARKLRLAVRGVVENMAVFTAPDGSRHELFGRGGGERLADDLGVPLLASLPFDPALREGGDVGLPAVAASPDGAIAAEFGALADRIAAQGPARVYRQELRLS